MMTNHSVEAGEQITPIESSKNVDAKHIAIRTIHAICRVIARFAEDTIKEREMFRDIPNMG